MFVFQHESVAPYPSSPVQEVSSEQGFNLAIYFLCGLDQETPLFSNSSSKEMSKLIYSIMGARYGLIKRWNQAVCQATNISHEKQKINNIRIEELFQCLIEFIKLSNEQHYNFQLGPLITLLEEMKNGPDKHPIEPSLWRWIIKNSHKRLVFPYAEFSTEKEISVEQGFHSTILFFEELYPIISAMFDFSKC